MIRKKVIFNRSGLEAGGGSRTESPSGLRYTRYAQLSAVADTGQFNLLFVRSGSLGSFFHENLERIRVYCLYMYLHVITYSQSLILPYIILQCKQKHPQEVVST
jgi:hypothetical protein